MAVARERVASREPSSLKNAAFRLAEEYDDSLARSNFAAAEKIHRHFYHASIQDWEWESDRSLVHYFVERVLALVE